MSELKSLLERVEKATGPDRELDAALGSVFRVPPNPNPPHWIIDNFPVWRGRQDGRIEVVHENGDGGVHWRAAPYTASLDAALALVEEMLPGWFWRAGYVPSPQWIGGINFYCWAHVSRTTASHCDRDDEATGWAHTVPLAILLALLRALISKGETNG